MTRSTMIAGLCLLVALVAGPAGEVALQQVVGPLRVGAGQPAGAGGPGALEGGAADYGENEEGHPPGDDQAPAVVAETGEASEHGSSRGHRVVVVARRFSGRCLGNTTAALEDQPGNLAALHCKSP